MTTYTNTLPFARTPKFNILGLLGQVVALHTQRKSLAKLDDRALCDLGLTRQEALHEATRPVWDVPVTWRKPQAC